MKIGLFGGSFDPIHRGHVEPVRQARGVLGLERVIYLPTGRPPHKSTPRVASAAARYAMVELALLHEEGLFVSPFELDEKRPSYTVDTLEHFSREHCRREHCRRELPDTGLVYILGADAWATFTTWRSWRRIVELAELAVLVRPGFVAGELEPALAEARAAGRLHFVANDPWPISSTGIRDRLARGEASQDLVPPLVLDYIHKYRLYRPA